MRCHICGKFISSEKMSKHLKKAHGRYYKKPWDYVVNSHRSRYGKEKTDFLLPRLFKNRKGTLAGLIWSLVTLLVAAILVNVMYPIVANLTTGLDPSFQLMVNLCFVFLFLGIIVAIIMDSTRGQQPQYGQPNI